MCSSHFDLQSELSKELSKWIQSLRSIRTPCMETPPRLHTRNFKEPARHHQGCLVCSTPTNHIRNLDEALNSSDATQTSPTTDELPDPPTDHPICHLNTALQLAIQKNNVNELKAFTKLYNTNLESNLEFCFYNRSVIQTTYLTAMKILDSHTAINTPLPSSPPNGSTSTHPNPSPYAHFKAPKVTAQKWSGKINEFYTWLHNLLNGF